MLVRMLGKVSELLKFRYYKITRKLKTKKHLLKIKRKSHPFGVAFSLVRRSKNEKVICWLVGSLFQFSNFFYFNMKKDIVNRILKIFKNFFDFLF